VDKRHNAVHIDTIIHHDEKSHQFLISMKIAFFFGFHMPFTL